jgi:hypothetical protein
VTKVDRGLRDHIHHDAGDASVGAPVFTRWGLCCRHGLHSAFGAASAWMKDANGYVETFPTIALAAQAATDRAGIFGPGVAITAEGYE